MIYKQELTEGNKKFNELNGITQCQCGEYEKLQYGKCWKCRQKQLEEELK